VNWNVGPWWALLISVVGGLVVVMLLSVGIFALTGFGEM
jgi:predicted membrane protein